MEYVGVKLYQSLDTINWCTELDALNILQN